MVEVARNKRRRITVPTSHEPDPGFWSNCFCVGDFVIIAGMSSRGLDGKLAHVGDPYKQSIVSFERMKAYIEAAGGTMRDIVKITAYLSDIRYRPDFIEARRQFFEGDFPVAVVVGDVSLASPECLVEIEAWGILGSGDET